MSLAKNFLRDTRKFSCSRRATPVVTEPLRNRQTRLGLPGTLETLGVATMMRMIQVAMLAVAGSAAAAVRDLLQLAVGGL